MATIDMNKSIGTQAAVQDRPQGQFAHPVLMSSKQTFSFDSLYTLKKIKQLGELNTV